MSLRLRLTVTLCFAVTACAPGAAQVQSRRPDGGNVGGGSGGGSGGGVGGGSTGGGVASAEICGNGFDDDQRGGIDDGCACTPATSTGCWPFAASQRNVGACRDGTQRCVGSTELTTWGACQGAFGPSTEVAGNCVDEDCDGQMPGCAPTCEAVENCTDHLDNDCDGLTDCADPGCLSDAACRTCPNQAAETAERCFDGIDNDCNGKVDCAEAECATSGCQMCEAQVPSESAGSCDDQRDDDCDGLIDCADPDCRFRGQCGCQMTESSCVNGVDDDCDGVPDCGDIDCEVCVTGAVRYCDEPNFCHFGNQTCGPDGKWGPCRETAAPAQCRSGIPIFGGYEYDQECCEDNGYCCQDYSGAGGSIGQCGSNISCLN